MSNDTAEKKARETSYRYFRDLRATEQFEGSIVPIGYGELDKKTVLKACAVALKSMNSKPKV